MQNTQYTVCFLCNAVLSVSISKKKQKKYYKLPIGVVMRYIKSFADVNDEWKWLGEKKALFVFYFVIFCGKHQVRVTKMYF